MRTRKLLFGVFMCMTCSYAQAQVQVDKPIQLTGTGSNGTITGIKQVPDASSATSAESIQDGGLLYAADNGSANSYSVTLSPPVTSYTSGMIVNFVAGNANTGASTLSVNGGAAAPIKKQVTSALAANDIRAGQAVSVMYDGTNFQMLSQLGNAGGGGGAPATDMVVGETLDKYVINTTRNTLNNPVNIYLTVVSGVNVVPITLSVSGVPSGVTYSFAGPSGGYPTYNSAIIFAVDNAAAYGTYNIVITATGGVAPVSQTLVFSILAPKIAFTTSTVQDGNLGGISGADAICQNLATAAGLTGTYKAWLSVDNSNSPSTLFNQSTAPYTNVAGQLIASSWACLIQDWGGCNGGQFMNQTNLFVDEYGVTVNMNPGGGGTSAWSATQSNGTWLSFGNGTCNGWTTNGFQSGDVGNNNGWSSNGCCQNNSCNTQNRLYCFQQ